MIFGIRILCLLVRRAKSLPACRSMRASNSACDYANTCLPLPMGKSSTSHSPMPCGAGYEDEIKKRRNVCFWHKAETTTVPIHVRFGGKADLAACPRDLCC